MSAVTICSDFGAPPKIKSVTVLGVCLSSCPLNQWCYPISPRKKDEKKTHLNGESNYVHFNDITGFKVVFFEIFWIYYLTRCITLMGFPDSSAGKESACNAEDLGLIPGLGRSPGEGKGYPCQYSWASLVAQLVKNPPAMQEIWVWSLGWEDPLEKGKATHSSILT